MCEKLSIPFDSTDCGTIFGTNNLKQLFSIWLYQSLTTLSRNCGPLFTTLLHFIEVCSHLFMHSYLKVPPQHFSWVEVWTLTGPLQHLGYCKVPSSCGCKNKLKSSLLHHGADRLCLVFAKHGSAQYGQTTPLWSWLFKEHCSNSLVVCPDATLQT